MGFIKQLIQKIFFVFLSAEKKAVVTTLQDYAAAFMTFNPANVLGYFEKPMFFLEDSGPTVFETDEELIKFLNAYMANLKAMNYATDKLSGFHIRTLTPDVVMTSFKLVRVDTAGKAFNNESAVYTWRKTDGSWKVAVGILLTNQG
ncbi:MAG: nuclear transport factor 2 family protein [Bacteroidetes bacterium]|nr:nuclear transport factor 2 family protein [Bacteroidota bacterium]